ncbi:hypothetical protein, partial [Streptomyces sp. NPDC059389]|uniref:hypothetical protein n=1 Tax=Streptomyces sp. NPDC059389 TaxID=3346818 RepID=UPI00369C3E61
ALVLGPAAGAVAAPVRAPAAPAVSCSLTEVSPGSFELVSTDLVGVTVVDVKRDGTLFAQLPVTGDSVRLPGLKAGTYQLEPHAGLGTMPAAGTCTTPPEGKTTEDGTTQEDARKSWDQGYRDGLRAIKESCAGTEPPKTVKPDENYLAGHAKGVEDGLKHFCTEKKDEHS